MNVTSLPFPQQDDPYPFEDFAPTLSQCFVIVIVGYLLARFELLSSNDVKGVNAFATYFAMPGIICVSLADASFEDFRWELLAGIFVGKLLIFLLVAGFLLLIDGDLGVAGLVALFCVHSNDLPVGNPLMSALYRDFRPQMMKYLFLIPAMTIIFFVPLGNIMVQVHRSQREGNEGQEKSDVKDCLRKFFHSKLYLRHLVDIIKHPVVIATVLGLVLNFVFGSNLPRVLHQPIKVAAATIPGIALALLGFCFVRKERFLVSSAVVPAIVLLVIKLLMTPILLHTILKLLTEESKSSKLLSDFALLYGIISPATAVFQLGQEFRKPLAVMSVALILTSFTCFLVSYVVARFTIITMLKIDRHMHHMSTVLFWSACTSMFCDVVVWLVIFLKKEWRQVPYRYLMCLVFTQFLTCCGVLLYCLLDNRTWALYCKMAFYYCGEISMYLWTGILAVVLVFKEKYPVLAENGFSILSFVAFSLSAFLTMVMCLLIPYNTIQRVYVFGSTSSEFEYLQLLATTILLLMCLLTEGICLFFHFKQSDIKSENEDQVGYENTAFYLQEQEQYLKEHNENRQPSTGLKPEKMYESEEAELYYKEMVRKGEKMDAQAGSREWTSRMTSLLMLQSMVLFVRFISNVYKLAHSAAWEIRIPLEFLQIVLFVGQGVIFLLTFGIDVRTVIISLKKWCRKRKYGEDAVSPSNSTMQDSKEVSQFCNQFRAFYHSRCFRVLAKERRWKRNIYQDSFWGQQLVDWLITEGLSQDDTEAEDLGQKLLMGRVIRHVEDRHQFYNAPYLYHFVEKSTKTK